MFVKSVKSCIRSCGRRGQTCSMCCTNRACAWGPKGERFLMAENCRGQRRVGQKCAAQSTAFSCMLKCLEKSALHVWFCAKCFTVPHCSASWALVFYNTKEGSSVWGLLWGNTQAGELFAGWSRHDRYWWQKNSQTPILLCPCSTISLIHMAMVSKSAFCMQTIVVGKTRIKLLSPI